MVILKYLDIARSFLVMALFDHHNCVAMTKELKLGFLTENTWQFDQKAF